MLAYRIIEDNIPFISVITGVDPEIKEDEVFYFITDTQGENAVVTAAEFDENYVITKYINEFQGRYIVDKI